MRTILLLNAVVKNISQNIPLIDYVWTNKAGYCNGTTDELTSFILFSCLTPHTMHDTVCYGTISATTPSCYGTKQTCAYVTTQLFCGLYMMVSIHTSAQGNPLNTIHGAQTEDWIGTTLVSMVLHGLFVPTACIISLSLNSKTDFDVIMIYTNK